ncbi:uncharacterized protein LOC114520054 isoform X2 [Dendronephthya gigantea]|uniref:uncharacterized protein LOC114520054 isoform X2 n=1 Tax=Dendronephthya gigantea TaxID=151771 RepID=UPI00106D13CC|nr:uncharacterized protein LOC114520054 isoform X2 [Dendronephthya gigantea]
MNHSSRFLIATLIFAWIFVANTEEPSLINRSIQVENGVDMTLPLRIRKNVDERLNFTTSEPSPEGDGTSEPSPEGDGTSEPSPEGDSTSEPSPEGDGTFEPSPEGDGTSEPSPEGDGTSEPSPEGDGTSETSPEGDGTSEPTPEGDGTSEPTPEGDGTSEPSPEGDGTSETSPEGDGTSEPSPEGDGTSEPSPEGDGTSEPNPEGDGTSEPSPEGDGTSESSPEGDGTSEPSPEGDGTSEPNPEGDGTSEPSPEGDGTSEPSPEGDGTSEPSPEGDGTSEPSPEGDGTSEPSPKGDGTSEPSPEGDGTSEPSPEGDSTSEPNPEGDGTSEPNPEGDGTSEPSPEGDGTSEPSPEGEGKSEPEPQPETWPEPGPEWEKAYKLWKGAWPAHNYIFAIIFLLMAFYSGYYVVFNVKDGLRKKYLSISLNVMMFILSITRSFVLFLDPYHQGTLLKEKLILHMMWSIGTPCLLASDSLCILALAESANVNLTHQRFQRLSNILVVISLHFVLVITTDIVVSAHMSAKVMILYCQVFSIIWGMLLSYWYFTLAHKINNVLFKAAGRRKTRGDRIYLLLIYLSSAANLFACILIIYSAAGVFGIYSEVEFVEAWPWFTLQTGMRTSEVFAAVLVFTVSAKRNRMKNKVHNVIVCGEKQEGRESSDTISTTPTVNNLYPSARNRRMSMFSAVHLSKISAQDDAGNGQQLNTPSWQPPSLGSRLTPAEVNRSIKLTNESSIIPTGGRRMSMFSQLQELKLSANGNNSIPPSSEMTQKTRPVSKNSMSPSNGRMSMFSQLQELKRSAHPNNSIPPSSGKTQKTRPVSKNSMLPSNGRRSMFSQLQELKLSTEARQVPENYDTNHQENDEEAGTNDSGIFSGLHHLLVSYRKKRKKSSVASDEFGRNNNRFNLFSKVFDTKVGAATTKSQKEPVQKLNRINQLCRSVESVRADVHVNDTVHTHGNMAEKNVNDTHYEHENMTDEHVSDTTNTHDHFTETYVNMTDGHVRDTHNVCKITRGNECRSSRRSLFAGLHGKEKLDEMKIIEDVEEEEED